jgi:hypothetical protein
MGRPQKILIGGIYVTPYLNQQYSGFVKVVMKFVSLSIGIVIAFLTEFGSSWNGEGHRIVARVANSLIKHKTARFVRDHLVGGLRRSPRILERAFTDSSTWADAVVDELEWSRELHFSHTPKQACAPFKMGRDCGVDGSGRCIVTAIGNYTLHASDYTGTPETRTEAIKFLVHFMADIHHPLHTGFAEGAGGNDIMLSAPIHTSLHEFWDSFIVEEVKARTVGSDKSWYGTAGDMIDFFHSENTRDFVMSGLGEMSLLEDVSLWVADIHTETVMTHTCNSAYKDERNEWILNPSSLSEEYVETRTAVAREQLMKAGVRLAQLLDFVASRFYSQEYQAASVAYLAQQRAASSVKAARNPFGELALEFDIDVEEAVFEIEVGDDSDSEVDAKPESVPMESTVVVPPTLSPEERKRKQNMKKRMRQKIKKRSVCGVDVERLVLIKRRTTFYITYRDLVTSDEYVPAVFMILQVRFSGMSSTDAPRLFLLDLKVFKDDEIPPIQLVRAIFKKLGGLDYSDETSPDDQAVESFSVRGTTRSEAEKQFELVKSETESARALMPFDLDYNVVSEETLRGYLPAPVTKAQLKAQYGGRIPSNLERIQDELRRMEPELIMIGFPKIIVLSRKEFLMDRSNRRWVFNRFPMIDSKVSLTESYFLYIDVRVIDDISSRDLKEDLERLNKSMTNRRNIREVIEKGSPILDRLSALSGMLGGGPGAFGAKMQFVSAFSAIRRVTRQNGMDTMEYVIREPEDEERVRKLMFAAPITPLKDRGASIKGVPLIHRKK